MELWEKSGSDVEILLKIFVDSIFKAKTDHSRKILSNFNINTY